MQRQCLQRKELAKKCVVLPLGPDLPFFLTLPEPGKARCPASAYKLAVAVPYCR